MALANLLKIQRHDDYLVMLKVSQFSLQVLFQTEAEPRAALTRLVSTGHQDPDPGATDP